MTRSRTTPSRQPAAGLAPAIVREHRGYSMIELMVILVIIGILLVIGIPALVGSRERSEDRAAQSEIGSVYSVEKIVYSSRAIYTDDPVELRAEEPMFTYVASVTPLTVGPIYVHLATGNVIYVMAESVTGTCFYLRDTDGTGVSFASSAACGAGDTQTYNPTW